MTVGAGSGNWEQVAREILADLREKKLHRHRQGVEPIDSTHISWQGRIYVNFASNDYLGLSHHPEVLAGASKAAHGQGVGSGASPLITGYGPAHRGVEQHIAQWKGTESAVVLPSGYQANLAAIQTVAAVADRGKTPVRFLLDKLSHASLIDAVRGTGMAFRVFPHNHLPKLRRLLQDAESGEQQVVVTESIFSMDGDAADLKGLADLKRSHPFVWVLDEAHASGVYGKGGAGLAAELGVSGSIDVTIITLSKSIGCGGGAVCGSTTFCEALVNLSRAYIYSTNLSPVLAAAADAALDVMEREPHRQERVRHLARRVRAALGNKLWEIPTGDSPIIPLVLGSESAAMNASESLLARGLFLLAIRPPTVARGTSRLRVTLSGNHTDEEIDLLLEEVARFSQG